MKGDLKMRNAEWQMRNSPPPTPQESGGCRTNIKSQTNLQSRRIFDFQRAMMPRFWTPHKAGVNTPIEGRPRTAF